MLHPVHFFVKLIFVGALMLVNIFCILLCQL